MIFYIWHMILNNQITFWKKIKKIDLLYLVHDFETNNSLKKIVEEEKKEKNDGKEKKLQKKEDEKEGQT